ncbi:Hypothetical protein R9X50_00076300 [Acrodontium crateriforme]|uniref:Mechanosensitive ion channel protein n=1 Tax=Acrodontium crateriforme TaxID=150365 RepID=A0AAQ3R291_9PEZI|nr:Hypothetical protein R9X50_00076300 [Acrodontium crateriforme]
MSTPVDEHHQFNYFPPAITDSDRTSIDHRPSEIHDHASSPPTYNANNVARSYSQDKSSDGEGTVVCDHDGTTSAKESSAPSHLRPRSGTHLTVATNIEFDSGDPLKPMSSRSQNRMEASRFEDEQALTRIEREISQQQRNDDLSRVRSNESGSRVRGSRRDDTVDEFDVATNPIHEKTQVYRPLENQATAFGKFVKKVHQSNWVFRYITYIAPLVLVLLIPLLLGALLFEDANVGGVYLPWFMIWLEIVWLTLWAGRVLAKCLPWPIGLISGLFTNNSKKWRDMGKQLELPATLFFWWLAIEISFLPTMRNHQVPGSDIHWTKTMNKVLVSIFVGAVINFVEKIIIQLIAISFHLRTYADRIELNKFQLGSLAKLYSYSREKIAMEDSEFEMPGATGPSSGTRTPGQYVATAAKTTKEAFTKFGDMAGKVAGDFTGRKLKDSSHPSQVVLALLSSSSGSQVLARRLYRTFVREGTESVYADDLKNAFESDEEAEAAFSMFDKDMNGDISMEELEAVCVDIGRERKSITASLKDLDSVVAKLDDILMFIMFIIVVLVFVSLISTSTATAITSAGSAVLALSWLFSATAQEFLQSLIFVFIKHPFDVGDRVTVYGNTGDLGRNDDYFVKEISLLYTEFKKMQGHVVQAPNSVLNGLFILNQRRSGGLAEAVPIQIKFGTTLDQIEDFRNRLLEFVIGEKREYQSNILTELRQIDDVYSMTLNVIFFYKSNWQNEGLRLARRNKFICAMMVSMQQAGIEGSYMRNPGYRQSFPMYIDRVPHHRVPGEGYGGNPDNPGGHPHPSENVSGQPQDDYPQDPPFVSSIDAEQGSETPMRRRTGSILRPTSRPRGESASAMNKRVDFSLGASDFRSSDFAGDVYADRNRNEIPINVQNASLSRERSAQRRSQEERLRQSLDSARSHSRGRDALVSPDSELRRSATNSMNSRQGVGSIHRNRFFGRPQGHDHQSTLEHGIMAGIPEGSENQIRIDPRSGLTSSAAVRMSTDESNINPSVMSGGALGRSQTEDFELRRVDRRPW